MFSTADQLHRQADQSDRGGSVPEGRVIASAYAKLVLPEPEDCGVAGAEQLVRPGRTARRQQGHREDPQGENILDTEKRRTVARTMIRRDIPC